MGDFTLSSNYFPGLGDIHHGTGTISNNVHVVDPASVDTDINTPFEIKFLPYNIQVLSLETGAKEPPNWFGVSFRKGISSFDTVNIFCHPHPGHAGMVEADYGARSGEWPKLFRYAEMFGRQIDIAKTNHITIVPFFTDSTYDSTGIFARNWIDLVEQIIVIARNIPSPPGPDGRGRKVLVYERKILVTESTTRKKGGPAPPIRTSSTVFSNVVLSCFSAGRSLLANVRNSAPGMNHFLREIWDFDGVGKLSAAPRILTYDRHKTSVKRPDSFHAPAERWVKFHNAVANWQSIHQDIVNMLACHAATISRVGK